jgi:hypoxanthine phosphoribosyltransferase
MCLTKLLYCSDHRILYWGLRQVQYIILRMTPALRCELISWSEVQRLCLRLAHLVRESGYHPDIVVAIGRGGIVPARLLCDYLDIMALTSIKIEHYLSGSTKREQAIVRYPLCTSIENQCVLLVDDVNDSGDTLDVALQHLHSFNPSEVRTAVMHHKNTTHRTVDYHARKIIKWRWLIYPWARVEDISAFIQRMTPAPETLQEIQQQLSKNYEITISMKELKQLRDLLMLS